MKIGWKIYFIILSFLLLIAYFDIISKGSTFFDYLDIIISLIALLGLFGYSFRKQIFEMRLWQTWLFVIVNWDILYNLVLTHTLGVAQNNIKLGFIEYIISVFMVLPEYIALYLYGLNRQIYGRTITSALNPTRLRRAGETVR
jgi:hypothetical protein